MAEITFHPDTLAANTGELRVVGQTSCVSGAVRPRPHGMPAVILSRQAYYWSEAWQRGEAEALAELEAGESRSFPDGGAAVRWLLSEDED